MADFYADDLDELNAMATDDLVVLLDTSDIAPTTQKRQPKIIQYDNLLKVGTIVQGYNQYLQNISDLTPTVNEDGYAITWDNNASAFILAPAGGADLPVPDTTPVVKGSADETKQLRFDVGGFTTGQTRVLTPPDADDTIAVLGQAQTFTASQTLKGGNHAAGTLPEFTIKDSSDNSIAGFGPYGNMQSFAPNASVGGWGFFGGGVLADSNARIQLEVDSGMPRIGFGPGSAARDTFIKRGSSFMMEIYTTITTIPTLLVEFNSQYSGYGIVQALSWTRNGTVAANDGGALRFMLESSTTTRQNAGSLIYRWITHTHASRASRGDLTAYYTSTERTCISWGANSSNPLIGFYGTTPAAKQTVTGSKGGNAALADLLTKLETLGLITDSTT